MSSKKCQILGVPLILLLVIFLAIFVLDYLAEIIIPFLTILAFLTACMYTVRSSAEYNMRKSIADFYNLYTTTEKNLTEKDTKDIVEIWVQELFTWRDLSIRHAGVTTKWIYSIFTLLIAYLMGILHKNHFNEIISTIILLSLFFSLVLSILMFYQGLQFFSYEIEGLDESWLTRVTRLIPENPNPFLSYKCMSKDYHKPFLEQLSYKYPNQRNDLYKIIEEA
ncbi:hypothetical protein ACFLY8_01255 [Halobacteriota archaeon]